MLECYLYVKNAVKVINKRKTRQAHRDFYQFYYSLFKFIQPNFFGRYSIT